MKLIILALALVSGAASASSFDVSTRPVRFSGDQRTEEQYAEAHGKAEAARAATSRDQAVRAIQLAEQVYISLQIEHPTLYRVYKRR